MRETQILTALRAGLVQHLLDQGAPLDVRFVEPEADPGPLPCVYLAANQAEFEPCLGQPGFDVTQDFEATLALDDPPVERAAQLSLFAGLISAFLAGPNNRGPDLGLAYVSEIQASETRPLEVDPFDDAAQVGRVFTFSITYFTPHLGA